MSFKNFLHNFNGHIFLLILGVSVTFGLAASLGAVSGIGSGVGSQFGLGAGFAF